MQTKIWPIILLVVVLATGCGAEPPGLKITNNARVPVLVKVAGRDSSGFYILAGGESKSFSDDTPAFDVRVMPSSDYIAELQAARGLLIIKRDATPEKLTPQEVDDIYKHIKAISAKLDSLYQPHLGSGCTVAYPEDMSNDCGNYYGDGSATIQQNPDGALVVSCVSPPDPSRPQVQ
ncbi:MAG: hypothetical protein WCF84_25505 [Anaerolineae bacterium]